MMPYWAWLVVVSLAFLVAERVRPWRNQAVLRPGWATDLAYLVLNGHFLGAWIATAAAPLREALSAAVTHRGWDAWLFAGVAGDLPRWAQLVVALVVLDLVQWCTHVALHKVPFLWAFHRVHHSVRDMDWAGAFRFHFMEIIVYRATAWLPLALFGFDPGVLFVLAVIGTVHGHFNHANVDVSIGGLAYVFNSPRMHLWHHHDEPDLAPVNFGVILSVWDWLAGTARLPDRPPDRLGFDDVESFPASLPGQVVEPFIDAFSRRAAGARPTPD